MLDPITSIIAVVILIMSVVVHEVSHGYTAKIFGDQTAWYAGRLTLNPLKHIDIFGSIIVPLVLVLTNAPVAFGWAKPVPVNERNFTNKRVGNIVVSSAGVLANFSLAIIFSIVLRLGVLFGLANSGFLIIVSIIVLTNIGLGIFNLIPVPPLDGSKILFALLPVRFSHLQNTLERNALVIVIVLMFLLWRFDFISPLIRVLFQTLTGVTI